MNDMPNFADPVIDTDYEVLGSQIGFAQPQGGSLVPAGAGSTSLTINAGIVTAQKVAVPRDMGRVLTQLKTLCKVYGGSFLYQWEVYDREAGRKVTIEGVTIKGAYAIARCYGNCMVTVPEVIEGNNAYIFKAAFSDLESGFTSERPFRQRRSQSLGMPARERDREQDLLFQIGASKAIRNAILKSLPDLEEYVKEESRTGLVEWVKNNGDKANAFIDRTLDEYEIDIRRVEVAVGRARKDWTVKDLTKVIAELRGLKDGLVAKEDLYPSEEDAERIRAARERENAEAKRAAGEGTKAAQRQARDAEQKSQNGAGDGSQNPASDDAEKRDTAAQEKPKRGRKAAEEPKPAAAAEEPKAPAETPPPAAATRPESAQEDIFGAGS